MAFEYCVGKLAKELNLTTEKVQGQNPVRIFGNDQLKNVLIQVLNRESASIEFRYKRKFVLCNLEPVVENGRVTCVTGALVDITERKKAEKNLTLFAKAFKSLNQAVSIADNNDVTIYVNPAFQKMYQYEEHEIIGKNSEFLRSPLNDPKLAEEIRQESLKDGWIGELYNRKKDGTDFKILLHTSCVRDDDTGEIIGFIGLAEEATPERFAGVFQSKQESKIFDMIREQHVVEAQKVFKRFHYIYSDSKANFIWFNEVLDRSFIAVVRLVHERLQTPSFGILINALLDQLVNQSMITDPHTTLARIQLFLSAYLQMDFSLDDEDNAPIAEIGILSVGRKQKNLRFSGARSMFVFCAESTYRKHFQNEYISLSESPDPQFKTFNETYSEGNVAMLLTGFDAENPLWKDLAGLACSENAADREAEIHKFAREHGLLCGGFSMLSIAL
ncbi:MAG: PAS domain S-box protein [Bacteroidia bacterium]|nr:PAS domain S-box protein [Bacteroidia bacterium]MDW8334842.1 PAS domain S-box protein [Bacteroidia bacterium]